MIDQTTLGHAFIANEFGTDALPTVGWQIDPFGHSATQASLLSYEVGFDALYFQRIDYQDKSIRALNSQLEMLWQASPLTYGTENSVFTGVFPGSYCSNEPFDWDITSGDAPVMDDPTLEDVNVAAINFYFSWNTIKAGVVTVGPDVMFLQGCDFHYSAAEAHFKNVDKLISTANSNSNSTGIRAIYSNPVIYTAAKAEYPASAANWSVKTDDFFPYASSAEQYWTGYFTSRPSLKRMVRTSSAILQAAKQIEVLFQGFPGVPQGFTNLLQRAQAVRYEQESKAIKRSS
jgi:alpha-mannosidase